MEFLTQSPDTIFFAGMFGMFFVLTTISAVAHRIFS